MLQKTMSLQAAPQTHKGITPNLVTTGSLRMLSTVIKTHGRRAHQVTMVLLLTIYVHASPPAQVLSTCSACQGWRLCLA